MFDHGQHVDLNQIAADTTKPARARLLARLALSPIQTLLQDFKSQALQDGFVSGDIDMVVATVAAQAAGGTIAAGRAAGANDFAAVTYANSIGAEVTHRALQFAEQFVPALPPAGEGRALQ